MKRTIPLLALVLAAILAGPAAAQNDSSSAPVEVNVGGNSTEPEPALEPIDNATAIEESRLEGDEMVLVLVSERSVQRVTLTDAGAVLDGGEVPQKTVTLREGRNLVRMPVTEYDGHVVVTIATRDVLYAVPIETSPPLIGGPWTAQDAQNAALGGGIGVALITGLLGVRRVKGVGSSPRRKL